MVRILVLISNIFSKMKQSIFMHMPGEFPLTDTVDFTSIRLKYFYFFMDMKFCLSNLKKKNYLRNWQRFMNELPCKTQFFFSGEIKTEIPLGSNLFSFCFWSNSLLKTLCAWSWCTRRRWCVINEYYYYFH